MEHLARAAGKGLRLLAMITPALPGDLNRSVVMPAADSLFIGLDEAARILGTAGFDCSVRGALAALNKIRSFALGATVYITMGRDGVMVSGPGGDVAFHVSLIPNLAEKVQETVRQDPTRVCGCGDAFLGGATAMIVTGDSLVSELDADPKPVAAAIAGCATAVRWLGFIPHLRAADFAVEALAIRGSLAIPA
jgi:sugar/nucleoside kinase (ribokinase family)